MSTIEKNTRKIINRLEADGWVNIGGGKHDKFQHPDRQETIVVPRHREQSTGVAHSIAKAVGWI